MVSQKARRLIAVVKHVFLPDIVFIAICLTIMSIFVYLPGSSESIPCQIAIDACIISNMMFFARVFRKKFSPMIRDNTKMMMDWSRDEARQWLDDAVAAETWNGIKAKVASTSRKGFMMIKMLFIALVALIIFTFVLKAAEFLSGDGSRLNTTIFAGSIVVSIVNTWFIIIMIKFAIVPIFQNDIAKSVVKDVKKATET